jgi:hypothetical protein
MVTKMNSYVQELQKSGIEKYNSQKNWESFSGLLIQIDRQSTVQRAAFTSWLDRNEL